MKQFYLFVLLMVCTFSSAQDSRLFDNYWYLTNVIKDGVNHVPPTTDMGVMFDSNTSLVAHGCLHMMATVTYEDNLTNFSGTNFNYCLCICNNPVANAYEQTYFSMINGGSFEQSASNDFTYSIAELDDVKTLTITSMFNEQAIYSNMHLATKNFGKSDFSFYPNPSTDFVEITLNNESIQNFKVEFFNELGQICKTEFPNSNQTKIETKSLSPGIYFIKVQNENATVAKKLIKL